MKRALTIAITVLAALAAPVAAAEQRPSLTVLFTGGPEDNAIRVALSDDGRTYVVDSVAVLEVGGDICVHPEGNQFRLLCEATAIAGFEVNAGGGDDVVVMARSVPIPVTLRGGPGDDRLVGGWDADKIVGGAGNDLLVGRGGADRIYGGPGRDKLLGASGNDLLRGGPGRDREIGGAGRDRIVKREPSR